MTALLCPAGSLKERDLGLQEETCSENRLNLWVGKVVAGTLWQPAQPKYFFLFSLAPRPGLSYPFDLDQLVAEGMAPSKMTMGPPTSLFANSSAYS